MTKPDNIKDLTIKQMRELQKKLNEAIIDREMAEAVAKANHEQGRDCNINDTCPICPHRTDCLAVHEFIQEVTGHAPQLTEPAPGHEQPVKGTNEQG